MEPIRAPREKTPIKVDQKMRTRQRELGWLDGIVDGESCFVASTQRGPQTKRGFTWKFELSIGNTNLSLLKEVQRIAQGGYILTAKPSKRPGKSQSYHWFLKGHALRKLLPRLRLVTKQEEQRLMIEALKLHGQHTSRHTPHDSRLATIVTEIRKHHSRKGRRVY